MLKHEAKLIDPNPEAVVAAFTEATAAANKRCRARLLDDDPAKWRKFARDAAAKPEGYALFRGGRGGVPATQIIGAWWTDAAGRKHVVLRGRRVEHDQAKRLLHQKELDERPPLWHAYPEYVCRRTVGKQSQIVCACGCGAVGTPESLGWMGETCGPCFDRKEEVGTGALSANLPGVLYSHRDPLWAVACSPDGARVAAVEGDDSVAYWDIPTRTRTVMKFSGVQLADVAITPDGGHLLAVGIERTFAGGLFAAFDLSADPPKRVDPAGEGQPTGWRVAALPDPGLVLVHRPDPEGVNTLAVIVRVPSGEVVRQVTLPPGYFGRFAVSPGGREVLVPGSPPAIYDLTGGGGVRELALRVATGHVPRHVAVGHDRRAFDAAMSTLTAYDAAGRQTASTRLEGKNWRGWGVDHVTALAADTERNALYAGTFNGTLYALAADTLRLRAAFEWHLGAVQGLAVSADGSRLFSSGGDGCVKVWPVSPLMKGLSGS